MLKAIVIGSPGAGKSTFARKLRDTTHLPLYYLDMLWHKPDQTTISEKEFDTGLHKLLKKDRWRFVFREPNPVSVSCGKIYHGWKRSLMKNIYIFHSRKEADSFISSWYSTI